jgi:hypothetical protein
VDPGKTPGDGSPGHEKGIDFDVRNLKPEDLEAIIEALDDLEVDVANGREVVKVFMEK